MQKTTLAALISATTLALTACGGGGGGGSPSTASQNTGNNTGNTGNTGAANVQSEFKDIPARNLGRLVVNGVNIVLRQPGGFNVIAGDTVPIKDSQKTVVVGGTKYKAMRFGLLTDSKGQHTVFVHGVETKSKPTSGTVGYTGLYISCSEDGIEERGLTGSVRLSADFGDTKKLTGTINTVGNKTYQIDAAISGNQFKGTAADNTYSEGRFYGDGAGEVGGIYKNGKLTGVFGGKKD